MLEKFATERGHKTFWEIMTIGNISKNFVMDQACLKQLGNWLP
jgi:hypothetical protein